MFTFNKKSRPTTVLIDSFTVLTDDQLIVDTIWQQRHATSNLAYVLAQTINNPSEDPLDKALIRYMNVRALSLATHQPIYDFVFSHQTGVSGTIWHHGEEYQLAVKGMPERVLEHCDMSENEREVIMMQLHAMSAAGLYTIALATGTTQRPIKHIGDLKKGEKLSFVGLVGLTLGVSSASRQCMTQATSKGISIYLATGLHPVAAHYLASQLGMASKPSDVCDARQLDTITPAALLTIVSTTNVFARTTSDQKEHIFNALKMMDKTATTVKTLKDFQKLLAN
jgi:Ca2+-transporting ATPase